MGCQPLSLMCPGRDRDTSRLPLKLGGNISTITLFNQRLLWRLMSTSHNRVQYITYFSGSYLEGNQRGEAGSDPDCFPASMLLPLTSDVSCRQNRPISGSGQYCFSRFYLILLLEVGNVAVGSVVMSFMDCQEWLMFFVVFLFCFVFFL